jgi:outer membrane protein TolC
MGLPIWKFSWPVTITGIGVLLMSVTIDPYRASRGPRHTAASYTPLIAKAATIGWMFIAILIVMVSGMGFGYGTAQAAEKRLAPLMASPTHPLTFDDSVKIAINQSPYFIKSSLEIDVRKMDETDSRYDMIPPLNLQTYYYVNQPINSSKPYYLSFSNEPYNPFKAYFTLQAQKLATKMAILSHLKTISNGIAHLGQIYLELDALKKVAAYQEEVIKLTRENLTYVENRMSMGTATSLDLKVVQQQLQVAEGELEQTSRKQKLTLTNLKNFLGLPPNQECIPDFRDSQLQVLGKFDAATVNQEHVKSRSYEIKLLEITTQLQKFNISLAKANILPRILFTSQTPNPLNSTTQSGLYVSFGLDIPVWDGFKRIRNVSRQKVVLRQLEIQKAQKSEALFDQLATLQNKVHDAEFDLKMARSQEELTRLKARQVEIRYQAGGITLPEFLASRQDIILSQKGTVLRNLAYENAVLALREISGDLANTYVDERSWQK